MAHDMTAFDVTRFQSLLTTGRFGRNQIGRAHV